MDDQNSTTEMAPIIQPYQVSSGSISPQMLAVNQTPAIGDMHYSNGTDFTTLPLGKENQFLIVSKAVPTWSDNDGWIKNSNTWTYSSTDGHTFVATVNADLTGVIGPGDRIKLTDSTTQYFIVSKTPTFAAPNTTITLYGGTQYSLSGGAITNPFYSHAKSPFGFNVDPSIWMDELSDTTDRTQASPVNGTWYNLGTLSLAIPIGKWRIEYYIMGYILISASGASSMFITLSTANNSESDIDFTTAISGPANGQPGIGVMTKAKYLTLATKTSYFVNAKADNTPTSITFRNSSTGGKMFVRAICAYL